MSSETLYTLDIGYKDELCVLSTYVSGCVYNYLYVYIYIYIDILTNRYYHRDNYETKGHNDDFLL